MAGRRGTREVVYLVHFQEQRMGHIVTHQLEIRLREQVRDVRFLAREEVIDADNVLPGLDKPVTEMGAEEAGAAGYEYSFDHKKSQ